MDWVDGGGSPHVGKNNNNHNHININNKNDTSLVIHLENQPDKFRPIREVLCIQAGH